MNGPVVQGHVLMAFGLLYTAESDTTTRVTVVDQPELFRILPLSEAEIVSALLAEPEHDHDHVKGILMDATREMALEDHANRRAAKLARELTTNVRATITHDYPEGAA